MNKKQQKPGNWSANGYWQEFKSLPYQPSRVYRVPVAMLEQIERAAEYRNGFKSLYD